ncbi:MAG: glycosyltransferase [Pseudomonadota bacterium]|nr:glycosyltransferase [Pseudomonadota bacterium]
MRPESAQVLWTISIVSHGHGARILQGIHDLRRHLDGIEYRLVLTFNASEDTDFLQQLPATVLERTRVIRNAQPRGFAANHNAALLGAQSHYVLAADPDLAIEHNTFPALEAALSAADCGIASPLACDPNGVPEDNGRSLVTPGSLLRRYLRGRHRDVVKTTSGTLEVDWLAGLFLALRSETFDRLQGFDEQYYMYCEDVDLGLRARALGLKVCLLCDVRITHAANRNTLKRREHFLWHVASLWRLWRTPAYRALNNRRLR